MNKACFGTVLLSLGLALVAPAVVANAQADNSNASAPATVIPPDQQATKEQLAKLFEVMRLREQMQNFLKVMPAMIQKQIQVQMKEMTAKLSDGGAPSAEQQASLDKLMGKYMNKAMEMYTIDEMLEDMTTIYQRHLSRADVDAFIVFYGSPAGQHLLNEQPAILQEYMPMAMKRIQERSKVLTDEMTKDMDDFIKSAAPAANKDGKN